MCSRVVACLMAVMVVASTGAPLEQQEGASRQKRTKEIVGSSLSDDISRTKRIDPNVGAPLDESVSANEAVLDKKASIETESGPAQDLSKTSPDVSTIKSKEQAVKDENEIIEKLFGMNEEEIEKARLEEESFEDEKPAMAEDMTEDEVENIVEGKSDEGEVTENKAVEEDSLPNISETYEAESSGEPVDGGQNEPYYSQESLEDLLYNYYDYTPRYYPLEPDYRNKRSASKRDERSLGHNSFTAEDMATADAKNNGRVKRDLEEDYIRELLGYPVDQEEEERELLGGLLEEALEEKLEEEEAERGGYGYEEEDIDSPTREEIEDTLQLLKYLYTSIPAEEQYNGGGPYEEAFEGPYEEEPYEDNYISKRSEMEDDEFEPIMYNGEPGYFVPLSKRTFLSSVPGTRKRSFYPYMEEPYNSYSGLVGSRASIEEDKRNDMEHERLFRMAEALRDPDWDQK